MPSHTDLPHRQMLLLAVVLTSLTLGACAGSPAAVNKSASGTITTEVPVRYRVCARLLSLPDPAGGWDALTMRRTLAGLRVSELEKRDCLLDLIDYTEGYLRAIAGK